jgi:hypothetical protein
MILEIFSEYGSILPNLAVMMKNVNPENNSLVSHHVILALLQSKESALVHHVRWHCRQSFHFVYSKI